MGIEAGGVDVDGVEDPGAGEVETGEAEQLRVVDEVGDDEAVEVGDGGGVDGTGAEEGQVDVCVAAVAGGGGCVGTAGPAGEQEGAVEGESDAHGVGDGPGGEVVADDVEGGEEVVHVAVEQQRVGVGGVADGVGGGGRPGLLHVLDEGTDDEGDVPGLLEAAAVDGVGDEDERLGGGGGCGAGAGGGAGGGRRGRGRGCVGRGWRRQPDAAETVGEREREGQRARACRVCGGVCVKTHCCWCCCCCCCWTWCRQRAVFCFPGGGASRRRQDSGRRLRGAQRC